MAPPLPPGYIGPADPTQTLPGMPTLGNGSGQKAQQQQGRSNPIFDETGLGLAQGSLPMAIAMYRRARGQQGPDKGLYGDFRENRMGTAVQALLNMIMPNSDDSYVGDPLAQANAVLTGAIGDLQAGRGIGGALRQQAASIMPDDLSGFKSADLLKILGAQTAAGQFGYGTFGQMPLQNAYDELENTAQQYELSPEYDPDRAILGQPGALNAFQALLQQYLGTR